MKKTFSIFLKKNMLASFFCIASILFLVSCSDNKKDVHIVIKVPTFKMTALNDESISHVEQFLEKAWNAFAKQYKKYKISSSITVFDQTRFNAAIDDCFDTPDAADVLYADYMNAGSYIFTGRVIPLDNIISESVYKDIDESLWQICRAYNGKIYMIPFVTRQNILVYNKDLFRKAGLDNFIEDKNKIQTWDLDSWQYILTTLSTKIPDLCSPLLMYAKNNQGDTHVMVLLCSRGSSFFDDQGFVHLNTPQGIAGLQWIADSHKQGFFPPHCEELEISDVNALFAANQLAISFYNIAKAKDYANIDLGYVNFPSQNNIGAASAFVTGFQIFDNGNAEKKEVSQDFVKFIFENEDWLEYSSGSIPCSKKIGQKYAGQAPFYKLFVDNARAVVDYQRGNPNWLGVRAAFYPHINALLRGEETAQEAAEGLDRDCNAAIKKGRQESTLHE